MATEGEHDHSHAEHDHDEHEHHHHDGPHDYQSAISGYRAEKDEFFKTSQNSPVPAEERATFEGLPYYPIDEDLVFDGLRLQPYTGNEPSDFQIPTSDNKLRPAHRAGIFTFDLDGPRQLTAYTFDGGEGDSLFVPFLDQTSGKETYGAGRYLDLEPDEDGTYAIDFNLAYHPSCVYAPQFSCPLTPAENRLATRVEAGERLPEGETAH
ncbi:MAG TPA: DUF1684 domain-containing protein [Candidatus Bathyarchaeia archaeon]|jgi:uncharacterized protein (DUF1684 family)|nr:DUF1684 domain-containing protein [Candidatus Bathyarchaeia archaeon]